MQEKIANYISAKEALKKHQEANPDVFRVNQTLLFALMKAEDEVKDQSAMESASGAYKNIAVTYTPQTQTYADIDEIDALIVQGIIPQGYRANIVKTVTRSPRISIREIEE